MTEDTDLLLDYQTKTADFDHRFSRPVIAGRRIDGDAMRAASGTIDRSVFELRARGLMEAGGEEFTAKGAILLALRECEIIHPGIDVVSYARRNSELLAVACSLMRGGLQDIVSKVHELLDERDRLIEQLHPRDNPKKSPEFS